MGVGAVNANAGTDRQFMYEANVTGVAASGALSPYFIGSLNHGKTTWRRSVTIDARLQTELDTTARFSWAAGVEILAGPSSSVRYDRWNNDSHMWTTNSAGAAIANIQQLWGEIKYRSVFMRVGQKDQTSALLNESLSSGDLTRSSNARGIPGVEVGFIDFQDIPFTNGWLQIDGVIEYGKMQDDKFNDSQFNYYTGVWTSDLWYTYKRCYFRTNPAKAFSVTLGMQAAGQFAGSTVSYSHGQPGFTEKRGFKFKDIIRMFIPMQGNTIDDYYEGNSLGTWDFKARYRLKNGNDISFAFQWPWEDGSGIGRRNGWDGLWGLYYEAQKPGIVTGAAIEYLDFTNQSGPIHWAPGDFSNSTLTGVATGGDDYYNNAYYNAWTNFGMAIATPFLVSPVYNTNGYPGFKRNRARGVHAAIRGYVTDNITYAAKYSWQQAWGSGRTPSPYCLIDNSMMVSVGWDAKAVIAGLSLTGTLAIDAGKLRGDNVCFMLSASYKGDFSFGR